MHDPKKIIRQLKSELAALHKEIGVLKEKESRHDRIRKALGESEEMYQKLLKISPNAVTVTDLEGNIIEVSQRTLELHGFKHPEELIGKNVFELIIPEDREKALENLNQTIKKSTLAYGIVIMDEKTDSEIRSAIEKYFDHAVTIQEGWL